VSERPAEHREIHTRLLECALVVDEARAYWEHVTPGERPSKQQAFDEHWFGAKSMARVEVLLANFRVRYDNYPPCLEVLHGWRGMDPVTRAVIGHWHLQLADPIYRDFTGDWLVQRRMALRAEVTRDLVTSWVSEHGPERWTMVTRIQLASKLLSAAHSAGLVSTTRDPRPLVFPRISDHALSYLLHLLRGVEIEGSLLDNPYLRSVGLEGSFLEERLRGLPALGYGRMGDLMDLGWRYPDLLSWARAEGPLASGGAA
jgi:hypothetical protein